MTPESTFKAGLRDGFRTFYKDTASFYFPIVANTLQKSGVPDIFIAADQRSAWIEVKANDGWLRPAQQLTMTQMARAGVRVVVLCADMRVGKKDRLIYLSDLPKGELRRNRSCGSWDDMKTMLFWHTILGVYE